MNPLSNPYFLRHLALFTGLAALAVGCMMSFTFGLSWSVLHACGFAILTMAGCILFPVAGLKREAGKNATGLFVLGALFLAVEFFSHVGYSVGTSVMEAEQTGAQNAAYATKQDSVKRNAATLESYRTELAGLKAQHPWLASVSADGLRAQIPAMDLAIAQETARGGCGPKCLKLNQEKADVEDRIALAERQSGIEKQIATLQMVVNSKETEATTAEFKSSRVVAQYASFAKVATLDLDPGRGALTWTQLVMCFVVAIVTTFLGPALLSVAFGPDNWVPGASRKITQATEKATDEASRLLKEVHALMARAPVAPVSAPAKADAGVVVLEKEDPRALAILRGLESSASNLCKLKVA